MKLRRFRADLHIHTCLSPCGELTMSPRTIVGRALALGLDIIAVTDHNSLENAAAAMAAARKTPLAVLPGMELTTVEEVHILALFDSTADFGPFQSTVYRNLPAVPSKRAFAQDQVLVDAADIVTGFSPHCLFGATRYSLQEAVDLVHLHGGLAIASHVDRESFSILSQLGFIPQGLGLDAVEISPRLSVAEALARLGPCDSLPMVRFSDAHQPDEIGRAATDFLVDAPALGEIRKALARENGRKIIST